MAFTSKNKMSNLNPSTIIGKVRRLQQTQDKLAPSFHEDLEPLVRLKKNIKNLDDLSFRMNYTMRELQKIIK